MSYTLGQTASDPNAKYLTFDIKKNLATSPEAAMLGRFGEVPIGYYTGTANISVPLYTLKVGDVTVPINLSYHSSGVKVEDEATWVGLGWSLEPEGSIIQVINGKEDGNEFTTMDPQGYQYLFGRSITGVYSQTASVGYTLWNCSIPCCITPDDPQDSQAILSELVDGVGQPDIYQFNLPGGTSGKFYINPRSNQMVQIDKKDSVKFERSGTGWLATTLSGDKYSFNALETSSASTLTNYTGRTWKLSKIISSNGKTATFTYYNGGYSGSVYNETYHDTYMIVQDPDGGRVIPSTDFTRSSTQLLTQIKTDNEIINFNLEDRQDIQGADVGNGLLVPKRLQSVDVVNALNNQKIKTFNFGYSYFSTSYLGNNYSLGAQSDAYSSIRLKLESLTEVGYTKTGQSIVNPAYKFTYNTDTELPLKTSYSRDFWGYYNGQKNTKLIPDLKYFYYSDFDNYKFIMPTGTLNAFTGANRTVDTTKIKAGLLTAIQYPTGGSTKFDYQPNAFANYSYPDLNSLSTIPGQITAIDQNNSGDNKSVNFTISLDQVVQISNYIQAGPPNATNNFDNLLPSVITLSSISNGASTLIKQWTMSTTQRQQFADNGNTITWLNEQIPLKAGVQYNISVELPDGIGPQNTAMSQASVRSIISYINPPQNIPQISYGGGVRIASISNYDKDGSLIGKKSIRYINADGSSSGKLMSPLQFAYYRYLLCVGPLDQNGHASNYSVGPYWFVSAQSAIPFSTGAGGNLVGYSRVEEVDLGANSSTNGKHIYYYNNTASQTKVNNPDIPDLLNGLIAEEDFLNGSSTLLKKVSYNYTDNNITPENPLSRSFTGAKAFSNFIGSDACFPSYDQTKGFPAKYEIDFYPINSAWYVLKNKQTEVHDGGNVLTTNEGIAYNQMGQIVRDSIGNSRNDILTTYNKFPSDIIVSQRTPIQQSLIDSSFYDRIIEQHSLKNQIETAQTKISYAINNNQLVRSKIERSVNRNPLYTTATFDKYGPNKTLQQVSEYEVRPSSLLWDQTNTFVISETTSALLTDVAYTSFELNQSGNWTIGSPARNTTGATGAQSYNLSNGSLSRAGLTAASTYVVSYWTQNGSPLTITGTISGYPVKGATNNGWTSYVHCITGQTTITISGTGNIDEVRLYPLGAQMTTYTYDPLIGMTSSTDVKGETTTYEYDGFLRLMNVKDKDGNIVKHMDYHYQGQ